VKVPGKGIHRNTRGRLSMEGLSMVFKDKLIESACRDGLVADHNEQGEAHERGKTMITKNHNTGSKKCYEKWSQDRLDKRLAEIELQLEIFEELLQRNGEDQRYGWILPKKVKWHTLQVKLKDRFNTKMRGALRTIEYEDKGCICEPEQGQILGEDEGESEGIDEIQESHIFKSDKLFMNAGFAGVKNEGQLSKTVMKIEGDRNMFSKPTKEEHGQNLVTRKSETVLSTTDNKHEELNAMTEGQMQNSVEGKNSRKRHSDFQSDDMFADYDKEKLSYEDNSVKGYHISNDWYAGFEVTKDGKISEDVTEMGEDSKPRYDEEYLSEEDSLELLQQKSYINILFDGGQVKYVNQAEHRKYDMRDSFQSTMRAEKKEEIKYSKAMFEKVEEKTIEDFLNLIEDLEQQKKELMIESSSKTIESYEINANNLSVYAGCATDNPFLGVVSSKAEVCPAGHNEGEHVKHKDAVLEEAEREILLLENLLKKSEPNWKLGLQVEKLCFNNLDEEMKYFEEHIGNDGGIKDSVEVLPNSKHENDMAEKDIFQGIHEVKVAAISTAMCGAAFVQEDDNRGQLLNIVQKFEDDEESNNSKFVIQQKGKVLEVLYTSRQMKVEMEKGIQARVFQKGSRLDEEIDVLWHLMQRCRKNYDSEVQAVIWMTEGDYEVHYRNSGQQQLQNKVWDPGRLKITVT
jgi:hypothetical protein